MDYLIQSFVKTENNVLIMNASRASWRCRQRNKLMNGERVSPFKFISYMELMNLKRPVYRVHYDSLSKL